MKWVLHIGFICFLIGISTFSLAQIPYQIIESNSKVVLKKDIAKDSSFLKKQVSIYLKSQQIKGYIETRYDSIKKVNDTLKYYFFQGSKYYWKSISTDTKLNSILKNEAEGKAFAISSFALQKSASRLLTYFENNGFPFAEVYFDSINLQDSVVSGRLNVNKNQRILIDSLIVKGESNTSIEIIKRVIGYKKGMLYSQKFINSIPSKINNLPYLSQIRNPEVFFTPNSSQLVLYVNDNGSNRFDGLIGLNPDENTGQLSVIGELDIDLLNALKRGERIKLNWERVKSNSQNFIAEFQYPFLFKTNIGITTKLHYYRQDTSFANLNALGGFTYFIDNRKEFGVNAQLIQSNSLSSPEVSLTIPTINSVSTLYYGATYIFNSLDYRINPRKGVVFNAALSFGNKRILKNQAISLDAYEEIEEVSRQIKTDVKLTYFQPLFKKSTVLFQLVSAGLIGDNIFENELYQIGGLKTLRGFNQQSIFATSFAVFTTEYRFLFDKNSSVFAFVDAGFYENNSVNTYVNDFPIGFGAGLYLQTGSGILTLTYGLGKQKNNPILIRNGKVHVGFISLF